MVSIGIGITTYNRPECLKECLEHIYKHTFTDNVKIYVATDTDEDRRGVAFRKNECLRSLKNCDYIFLFDDDCYPIKEGWIEFFIKKMQNISTSHLLYLNDKLHNKTTNHVNDCYVYNNCGGVFMALTKGAISKVGAFNEDFKTYGFEHAEYSKRVNKAGFCYSPYLCAKKTEQYLYSHDYSTLNHKSSITDEEKQVCIKNNWDKFFNEPIKSVFLPL
jgi:glycosyltransferase involved in cell wall biosynthesis